MNVTVFVLSSVVGRLSVVKKAKLSHSMAKMSSVFLLSLLGNRYLSQMKNLKNKGCHVLVKAETVPCYFLKVILALGHWEIKTLPDFCFKEET